MNKELKKEQDRVKSMLVDQGCTDPDIVIELEKLLYLAEKLGETDYAEDLYRLLTRQDLIYDHDFTADNYLLANGRKMLRSLSYKKKYIEAVSLYNECPESCRMYTVNKDALIRNTVGSYVCPEREEVYEKLLITPDEQEEEFRKGSKFGESYSFYVKRLKRELTVEIPVMQAEDDSVISRERKEGNISLKMTEILKEADEMDQILGGNYRRRVLEDHVYQREETLTPVDDFKVFPVTNLAGQVGAGKSTFSEAVVCLLGSKGYRSVVICSTVAEVIAKAEMFEKMGLKSVPLVGRSSRKDNVIRMLGDEDCLSGYESKVLQQPCMLNAFLDDQNAIMTGEEPCRSLIKGKQKNIVCPCFAFCPVWKLDREILSADVVVTTLNGMTQMKVESLKMPFMTYMLKNFNLVVIDEADEALCKLDQIFAPVVDLEKVLSSANDLRTSYVSESYENRVGMTDENKNFVTRLNEIQNIESHIASDVQGNFSGWNDKVWKKPFSSLSLLNSISREDNPFIEKNTNKGFVLKDKTVEKFRELIFQESNEYFENLIQKIVSRSNLPKEDILNLLCRSLANGNQNEADKYMEEFSAAPEKIVFLAKVIAFEQKYRELSAEAESMMDIPSEIYSILARSQREQQLVMPASPVGNVLSMVVDDNGFKVCKEFACGRVMALKMPYLRMNPDGSPGGPCVLLMSGTGYVPGSWRYHIPDPVNYVIQATDEKRNYISKASFYSPKGMTKVSGTGTDHMESNLKNLIKENDSLINRCLKNGQKILMVCNSYDQCKAAYQQMTKISAFRDYTIIRLTKEMVNGENSSVELKDIEDAKSDVLIVPAALIQRGYNIVDDYGNAWYDTLMFLVRPLPVPDDYNLRIQNINGAVVQKYYHSEYESRVEAQQELQTHGYTINGKLNKPAYGLSTLEPDQQTDIVAGLFVLIEQVFGRLCRAGNKIKEKTPEVYFLDRAFVSEKENRFDTLAALKKYVGDLIEQSEDQITAKTLYQSFYDALERMES